MRRQQGVVLAAATLALLMGSAARTAPGTRLLSAPRALPTRALSAPVAHAPAVHSRTPPSPAQHTPPYTAALRGRVVSFGLRGFEPDFDPLYAVVLSLTMRDMRPAPLALPPATLILDLYLERFQPDTTPLLPDLLHPAQTATHLAGFLQGQAALVNQGGQIAYQGLALAEVFPASTVQLVLLHLQAPGAPATAPALRVQGTLTLYKGGTQTGHLQALTPLAGLRAALAVPRGPALSWRRVVQQVQVPVPRMVGTAGGHPPQGTPAPANNPLAGVTLTAGRVPAHISGRQSLSLVPLAVATLLLAAGLLVWRLPRWGRPRRSDTA